MRYSSLVLSKLMCGQFKAIVRGEICIFVDVDHSFRLELFLALLNGVVQTMQHFAQVVSRFFSGKAKVYAALCYATEQLF